MENCEGLRRACLFTNSHQRYAGTVMFCRMQVSRIFQLSKLEAVDQAVAKLLEFTDYPHHFTSNIN